MGSSYVAGGFIAGPRDRGHAHLAAREEVEPGRIYLNAGDWITHFSYVTIPVTGAPKLRQWVGGSVEHGTGRPAHVSRV